MIPTDLLPSCSLAPPWRAFSSVAGYFSATSGNSINSHLFASVIQASRMRAKYSRSSGSSASFASAAHLAAVSHAVSRLDRICLLPLVGPPSPSRSRCYDHGLYSGTHFLLLKSICRVLFSSSFGYSQFANAALSVSGAKLPMCWCQTVVQLIGAPSSPWLNCEREPANL